MSAAEERAVVTYTTAPEDYDGFGTRTVRVAGAMRGKSVREVQTPARQSEWQRQRYYSGGIYLVADPHKWGELVAYGIAEAADDAPAR